MNHTDHVNLLREGISEPGGVWAEFGSGSGAFTMALAELLGCFLNQKDAIQVLQLRLTTTPKNLLLETYISTSLVLMGAY